MRVVKHLDHNPRNNELSNLRMVDMPSNGDDLHILRTTNLPRLHRDAEDEMRWAASEIERLRGEKTRLIRALSDTIFAAETSEACLKTWNDGKGGPADVAGILTRAKEILAKAEGK